MEITIKEGSDSLMKTSNRMPVLFVGHGSPMNAIEDNPYTKGWMDIAERIPRPTAILAVSAHWYTKGSRINDSLQPKLIYDMYGFPKELYEVQYNVEGSPELANTAKELIHKEITVDNSWGIDHGTWSVLCRMYPKADIPVVQLSIDRSAPAEEHYLLGQELSALRDKGVLILGSGNVVHNLSLVRFDMEQGFPWAQEFDQYIKNKILSKNHEDVIHYKRAGEMAELAFYTPDHYYPLLYVLGASQEADKISVYNESSTMGSLSMTSYLFEA